MSDRYDGCDAVLLQNVEITNASSEVRFAALQSVTAESYEKMTTNAEGGAAFLGISLEGGYSGFDERRREYIRRVNYNVERRQALSVVKMFLTDKQIDAWVECKTHFREDNFGFGCWWTRSSKDSVTVEFYWNPPPDAVQEGTVDFQSLIGGKAVEDGVPLGKVFRPGYKFIRGKTQRTFLREFGKELVLDLSVNRIYADGISLPRPSSPLAGTWKGQTHRITPPEARDIELDVTDLSNSDVSMGVVWEGRSWIFVLQSFDLATGKMRAKEKDYGRYILQMSVSGDGMSGYMIEALNDGEHVFGTAQLSRSS